MQMNESQFNSTPSLVRADCARRISSNTVREICGGISDMTLWRWLNDAALDFPKPAYIARRRYWREADVLAWLDAQSEKGAA